MDDFFAAYGRECAEEEENKLRAAFKKGKHTHALNENIDVTQIKRMREAGKTYREIAVALGCSPSTVRNRWFKIQSLKKESHGR